jgi:hypothetical protein
MTPDLGTPIGHREIIRQINAQKAAEAKAANDNNRTTNDHNPGQTRNDRPHNPGQQQCTRLTKRTVDGSA